MSAPISSFAVSRSWQMAPIGRPYMPSTAVTRGAMPRHLHLSRILAAIFCDAWAEASARIINSLIFCDENGIIVWQDFAMACADYPCDERFEAMIREEATAVVREYRHHPSIILWSGDNEVDQSVYLRRGCTTPPSHNSITRKILPYVVERNDLARPYLQALPITPMPLPPQATSPPRSIFGVRATTTRAFNISNAPRTLSANAAITASPHPHSSNTAHGFANIKPSAAFAIGRSFDRIGKF